MGMSTLPVKPRDRVRRRAQAADGGRARPKAPVSGGDFPKPDKQLESRCRHYGLGEGEDSVPPINDLRCPAPVERAIAAPEGCRKVTLEGFPPERAAQVPIPPPLAPTVPGVEPAARGFRPGEWVMWIIWYVAMMASLRAVGLAPNPVPVRIDEDRKPYGDF